MLKWIEIFDRKQRNKKIITKKRKSHIKLYTESIDDNSSVIITYSLLLQIPKLFFILLLSYHRIELIAFDLVAFIKNKRIHND